MIFITSGIIYCLSRKDCESLSLTLPLTYIRRSSISHDITSGIIYCLSRKDCESLSLSDPPSHIYTTIIYFT